MIRLKDLISLAGIDLVDFKIHCATGRNPTPLETFFEGTFKQLQDEQNQKNFQCSKILSLIHIEGHRWLFAGVYFVDGVKDGTWKEGKCYEYITREMPGLDHLTGKAIIEFKKLFRASYLRGEKHIDRLFVTELRNERMTIGDFPGYNSVRLSYRMLKTIFRERNPSWRSALSNVSGVYLISDTSNGKIYIGSAYGGEGIWNRWNVYAKYGHGGNRELRELLREKGEDHLEYFQFSLLEVCDLNSNDKYIIEREVHWKSVLMTREFGLNKN